MEDSLYQDFIKCRQTKFFSKGIQPVLDWLQLRRKDTELKDRKTLEMFGYILRTLLQRIVLEAVKIENDGELKIMNRVISITAYRQAATQVRNEVCKSANDWFDQITAFQTFKAEQESEDDMAKIKEKWDGLQEVEQ